MVAYAMGGLPSATPLHPQVMQLWAERATAVGIGQGTTKASVDKQLLVYGLGPTPGVPTIGVATQTGATTATVAYTAPADNGGSAITSYTATSTPGGKTGTGASPITVATLTTATQYTFTVHSTNANASSAESPPSNQITTA